MSIKLKALGLGLLAMMAMGAFAVTNAGAIVSGHFEFGSEHTFVTGIAKKGTSHELHLVRGADRIGCDISEYKGTHKGTKTTTELTITPNWDQCYTTGTETKFGIHENGCHLVFKSRTLPEANDATVTVVCPQGQRIVITHPNCETTVVPQTVGGAAGNGVTYTTQTDASGHWITMNVKVTVPVQFHGGICIFLGTNQHSIMEGNVTVTGFSNAAHTIRTNITAT